MTSVIRLLPRKKIEKHVTPYSTLLSTVLSKRLRQAFRTTVYFLVPLSILLAQFYASVSLKRTVVSMVLVAASTQLMLKASLSSEAPKYSSIAATIARKLTWLSTYIFFGGYALSALTYNRGIIAPGMPAYSVAHAEPVKLPKGIPSSLALHKTDHWYILNERYLYISSFVYLLSYSFAVCAAITDAHLLRIDPAENGMKPSLRIKRRLLTGLRLPGLIWAGATVAWPLIYFLFVRTRATSSNTTPVVTLSGFHWSYVFLPVLALPLCITWGVCYEVFMAYLSLGPIHRGKPISDAARTDKNESLVDGLSQPASSLSCTTAWHELLLIAEHDELRRRSIYSDVDADRVVWEKISEQFHALVNKHVQALAHDSKKHESKKNAKPVDNGSKPETAQEVTHNSTRTSTAELLSSTGQEDLVNRGTVRHVEIRSKNPKIYKSESAFEKKVASFTRSLERKSTTKAQAARAYLLRLAETVQTRVRYWTHAALATKWGAVFRKPTHKVLASKLDHPQTTAFAIRATARMITKSISEDEFGYVQSTIAATLAALDSFSRALEKLIADSASAYKATKEFSEGAKPDYTPALTMLGESNGAFAEIAEVFQPYFENLQVSKAVTDRTSKLNRGELVLKETVWLL